MSQGIDVLDTFFIMQSYELKQPLVSVWKMLRVVEFDKLVEDLGLSMDEYIGFLDFKYLLIMAALVLHDSPSKFSKFRKSNML